VSLAEHHRLYILCMTATCHVLNSQPYAAHFTAVMQHIFAAIFIVFFHSYFATTSTLVVPRIGRVWASPLFCPSNTGKHCCTTTARRSGWQGSLLSHGKPLYRGVYARPLALMRHPTCTALYNHGDLLHGCVVRKGYGARSIKQPVYRDVVATVEPRRTQTLPFFAALCCNDCAHRRAGVNTCVAQELWCDMSASFRLVLSRFLPC